MSMEIGITNKSELFFKNIKEIKSIFDEMFGETKKYNINHKSFEKLKLMLIDFSSLLKIERINTRKDYSKNIKKLEELVNIKRSKNNEDLKALLEQNIGLCKDWLDHLNQIEGWVYYNAGKSLYFYNKEDAKKVLKKVKVEHEQFYFANLIINLLDKKISEYCKSIGFDDDLLQVLLNAFNSKQEFYNDPSLHEDLRKIKTKHTKVIMYLINFYVYKILNHLKVDFNEYERKVAHYTSLYGFEKIIKDKMPLRLNSADLMNDPSEGKLIFSYLNLLNNIEDNTFLTCFTFNHNSLNQFRLYGRSDNIEGTGISLVFNQEYFSTSLDGFIFDRLIGVFDESKDSSDLPSYNSPKLPLFRCAYIDVKTGFIDVARRNKFTFYQEYEGKMEKDEINNIWMEYDNYINEINLSLINDIEKIKELISIIKNNKDIPILESLVNRSLRPLRFLFKHIAFQEEQESRVFYITNLLDNKIKIPENEQRVIYEYKQNIHESLCNVYIGPALSKKVTYIEKILASSKVTSKVCDSPFTI